MRQDLSAERADSRSQSVTASQFTARPEGDLIKVEDAIPLTSKGKSKVIGLGQLGSSSIDKMLKSKESEFKIPASRQSKAHSRSTSHRKQDTKIAIADEQPTISIAFDDTPAEADNSGIILVNTEEPEDVLM